MTLTRVTTNRKPKAKTRRDRNPEWKRAWREQLGGPLVCAMCGLSEKAVSQMDIDHIVELQDGGVDEMWNTVPLCGSCHTWKNSARALIRAARRGQ